MLFRSLLPMAGPILAVVFLLSFIGAVIEYPVASVLLTQQDQLTLAVGAKLFVHEHQFRWGDFAAAAILSGLPITAVFLLAQRWLVAGLAAWIWGGESFSLQKILAAIARRNNDRYFESLTHNLFSASPLYELSIGMPRVSPGRSTIFARFVWRLREARAEARAGR